MITRSHNETTPSQEMTKGIEFSKNAYIDYHHLKKIKQLQSGTVATVYQGEWNGKTVAIKEIEFCNATISSCVHEKNMIQKLAQLQSPYIIGFFGYAWQPDKYLIILEYMPKGDICDYLCAHPNLEWGKRLQFMSGIAHGLTYMHAVDVVHRDIKPENVLLGNNDEIKICDFDTAKQIDDVYELVGTNHLIAPEVLYHHQPHKKPSDVFSLGKSCFIIFTSKHPKTYENESTKSILPMPGDGEIIEDAVEKEKTTKLINDCCAENPVDRPNIDTVVKRLTF